MIPPLVPSAGSTVKWSMKFYPKVARIVDTFTECSLVFCMQTILHLFPMTKSFTTWHLARLLSPLVFQKGWYNLYHLTFGILIDRGCTNLLGLTDLGVEVPGWSMGTFFSILHLQLERRHWGETLDTLCWFVLGDFKLQGTQTRLKCIRLTEHVVAWTISSLGEGFLHQSITVSCHEPQIIC
jgi:hypothetical protein